MPGVEVPPVDDFTYTRLKQLLRPAVPQVLELSVLPSSSSPPTIQYDPDPACPALAIPKSLLVGCFLRARSILFAAKAEPSSTSTYGSALNAAEKGNLSSEGVNSEEIYGATSILLLFEPNHQTAANWRKRHLLRLHRQLSRPELQRALRAEWTFITSLLTSPLPPHHAKSPTLWHHRLWLLRNFVDGPSSSFHFDLGLEEFVLPSRDNSAERSRIQQRLWRAELEVVMRAADRHPRNYYGWRYARDVRTWIFEHTDGSANRNIESNMGIGTNSDVSFCLSGKALIENPSPRQASQEQFDGTWSHGAIEVHRWCLQHPRDISGWSFLAHLLHYIEPSNTRVKEAVLSQTISFTQKYSWKGESLDWFLTQMASEQGIPRKEGEKQ